MRFSTVVALLASAVAVSAKTIQVQVGNNGTLTFMPNSVTASVGDVMSFTFMSKNHTITQSTFASPCSNISTPMSGVDSGFVPVPTGSTSFPQYSFTVQNASAPLWFYCRQTGHCQKGMVFAINPTASKTFAQFQQNAMNSSPSGTSAAPSATSGFSTVVTGDETGSATAGASATATSKSGAAQLTGSTTAGVLALLGLVVGMAL